jgi:predicted NUDIX family NTP pyrophosphohydrolase
MFLSGAGLLLFSVHSGEVTKLWSYPGSHFLKKKTSVRFLVVNVN